MLLGEGVDFVVEEHYRHIHVVANGVNPVAGADGDTVAVPRGHPDVELRPTRLDTTSHRKGTAMQTVETVGAHVVGKPA